MKQQVQLAHIKYIFSCAIVFIAHLSTIKMTSQGPHTLESSAIKSDLPTILPPSPTVASLMKFEEVPVNNYTGIPNISLPIYSFPTHSKDLTVDISLSYHPSSIAANEVASYVGLGWNLIAGGTISRTVKGLPDDLVSTITAERHGIHDPLNKYYLAIAFLTGNMGALSPEAYLNFIWDVQRTGNMDAEHDLYQFNFMGHTGRFMIQKGLGAIFNIVKLDNDNNLLVEYDNTAKTFTIYDDKGLKYVFDEKETTVNSTAVQNQYLHGVSEDVLQNGYTYNSAFHLTKIYDTNNQLLVKFNLNTIPMKENTRIANITTSRIDYAEILGGYFPLEQSATQITARLVQDDITSLKRMMPQNSFTVQNMNRNTKKLESIDIYGFGKVIFENIADRQDDKLNENSTDTAYRLNSITIKNFNNTEADQISKFTLQYDYSTILDKRLMLTNVTEQHEGFEKKYKLEYNKPYNYVQSQVGIDYWGFFNYRPDNYPATAFRDSDKEYCKVDVLEKIVYPSGGCAVFDFESNTYSYIGDEPITNFDENPENFTYEYIDLNFQTVNGIHEKSFNIPSSILGNEPVVASFVPTSSISPSSSINEPGQSGIFTLFKLVAGAPPQDLGLIGCGTVDGTCITDGISLLPGTYKIRFSSLNMEPLTGSIQVQIKRPLPETLSNKYLYGGGLRINKIAYYDTNVLASSIDLIDFPDPESNGAVPVKYRKYDYRFFGQSTRTSGSLSFPKPKFDYNLKKECYLHLYPLQQGQGDIEISVDVYSKINTTFNNLSNIRTKGSDVGYENVTVFEEGNGKTEFIYTSPISDPETNYTLAYPFQSNSNIDHRRGLLKQSTVYKSTNNVYAKINSQINEYEFVEDEKLTGLTIFALENYCRYLYKYPSFPVYYSCITNLSGSLGTFCQPLIYCDAFTEFVQTTKFFEKFGWARLKKNISTDYFYNNGVEMALSTIEDYQYNSSNKKISSKTITTAQNDIFKTDYLYHIGNSTYSKNRIGEISQINSYKNGEKLSTNKVIYATGISGNTSYLPQTIQSSKGTNALENKLQYNRYDQFGNILEVQQENGTKVSYIWGYNQTKPVAKIENMAYTDIPIGLITTIQNETDSPTTTETAVINALNALRTSTNANLQKAMITTYTYKPLVGISTVTDPKGDKITYHYDNSNRLAKVTDMEGNILTENQYNYRTQN